MPSFINDGYHFRAVINPVNLIHDGMEFVYRPATANDIAEYQSKELKGKAAREAQAKILMDKVKSWKLPSGIECPTMTVDVLCNKLNPELFTRMFYVVMQWEAPDSGEECDLGNLEKN